MQKMKLFGQKSELSIKLYGKWVQFYARLPADGFIFRIWREFQSVRINDSLAVFKCSRLCVNFHVGTFRMHTRLLANFNSPPEHVIKVVLII